MTELMNTQIDQVKTEDGKTIPVTLVYNEEKNEEAGKVEEISARATIKDDNGNVIEYRVANFAISPSDIRKRSDDKMLDWAVMKSLRVNFQNVARTLMQNGDYEHLKGLSDSFVLGMTISQRDPVKSAKSAFDSMSADDQLEVQLEIAKKNWAAQGLNPKQVEAKAAQLREILANTK